MKILLFSMTVTLHLMLLSACSQPLSENEKVYQEIIKKLPLLVKDSTLHAFFQIEKDGISLYKSKADKKSGIAECKVYPDEYEAFARLFGGLHPDTLLEVYLEKGAERWADSVYGKWLGESQPAGLAQRAALPRRDVGTLRQRVPSDHSVGLPAGQSLPDSVVGQPAGLALQGIRIALDPGHSSATPEVAEVEGKYVKMRPSSQTRMQEIVFNEANLTLATALALQEKLIAQGVEVLMTRSVPGMSAMGIGYPEWRETQFQSELRNAMEVGLIDSAQANYFRTEATEKEIFINLFNRLDLLKRAKMINTFHPDLTVILHYNIDSKNWERRDADGFMYSGSENYSMAFVPGSFMFRELEKPVDRLAFLRLLLTDDLEASISLSGEVVDQFEKKIHVPAVTPAQQLTYLRNACITTSKPGVFARNLTLTRLIHGPLCYGESLCQDNIIEAQALNKQDAEIGGIPTSSRVMEVAEAYYLGVMGYLNKN